MKLKSALKALKVEQLRQIAEFWQLDSPDCAGFDVPAWVDYLYPRLQNPTHYRNSFEALEDREKEIVEFLAIHGGNLEEKEMRRRCFAGKRAEMKEVVESLMAKGFLCCERWTDLEDKPRLYGLPEPFLRFIELPHFWRGYLGAQLREITADQLHEIVNNGLKLKAGSNKRDRLVYLVRRRLTDPESLRACIDALPEQQREILLLIAQRRGVALYSDLLELIQGRRADTGRAEHVEALLARSGLLFRDTDNASKYNNLLRIPRDLYYIITNHFVQDNRGLQQLDAISSMALNEEQPKIIRDNALSLLRDLVIFAGYVSRNQVRRLGNGGIGKNDLKKILPRLSPGKTTKYTQFLAHYCICNQFLVPTGGNWDVSNAFVERLEDSRALYLHLYTGWLESNEWNEEYIDGDCRHADAYPTNLVHITELRKLVLKNLAEIPFDTWVDGPRFIESLLAQIDVQVPNRGNRAPGDKHNRINYLVVETILCESLYWTGLLSLGLSEDADFAQLGNRRQVEGDDTAGGNARIDRYFNFNPRPQLPEAYHFHFRITGLGRSILEAGAGQPDKLLHPKTPVALPFRDDMLSFTVLPNHDVVAPPDLNLVYFYKLRQFAEVRSIDVMSTLAITHDSIRAGMDAGLKGEEIVEFLEKNCPSGIPETVRHLVRECSNRYGELTIGYAGGYIRVDDPVVMEDLRNNKALAGSIKDVLGENVILLSRNTQIQQIARELRRLGFMPQIDNENVYTSSEGRLRFSLTPEDLGKLMGILQFVLQVEKEMGADITEESTRPLLHALRPTNHSHLNLEHFAEVTEKRFDKNFQAALKKKVNSVANKYRKQMREFLSQRRQSTERPHYEHANPAEKPRDIKRLLEFAIDHESPVELHYLSTTREETHSLVRPESINGDKLFTYSEEDSNYCAYRLKRIVQARLP